MKPRKTETSTDTTRGRPGRRTARCSAMRPSGATASLVAPRSDETRAKEAPNAEAPPEAELIRAYSAYVARIALRCLGRSDELEDVIQDVFLEALRGLRSIREPGAIKGWLATVTVRVASRRRRARRLRADVTLDSILEPAQAANQEQSVSLAQVRRALDRVPARERAAWILSQVEGYSLDEVARRCGCSIASAKRRIGAARRHLLTLLGP